MLLFSFLLLPVVLSGFCLYYRDKKIVLPIFIGFMSGILVCAFKTFFLYSHRIIPYSLGQNFIYFFFRQTFLPVVILYLLFFLFSKDDYKYKVDSCCPLLLSFYMIFLPYMIVTSAEGLYSGFALFVKPVVYTFMIIQVSYSIKRLVEAIVEKNVKIIVLQSLFGLIYLVLPAVIESFCVIDKLNFVMTIVSVIYCAIPFFFFFVKRIFLRNK